MKPYINLRGKGLWTYFWEDKVKPKMKKIFKKSARQLNKKIIKSDSNL